MNYQHHRQNEYDYLKDEAEKIFHDIEEDVEGIKWKEILRKIFSYSVEGLAMSTAAYGIPKLIKKDGFHSDDFWAIIRIGLVAAAVFAILDMYAPKIGGAARIGAGLAIGAYQIGGIPVANK